MNVGSAPKTMQHIFLDNKSIQTAAESSIPLALFAGELSAEIQLETRGSVQQLRGQTKQNQIKKLF